MDARTRERIVRTVNRMIEEMVAQGKLRRDAQGEVRAHITDIDGSVGKWQLLLSLLRLIGEDCSDRRPALLEFLEAEEAYRSYDLEFPRLVAVVLETIPRAIRGMHESFVQTMARRIVERDQRLVYPFSQALLQAMYDQPVEHRRLIISVSGAPQVIVEPFCKVNRIDVAIGCEYFTDERGFFTGERDETPAIRKHEVLAVLAEECGIDLQASTGKGDTRVDLPILESVSRVGRWAINPKLELLEHIRRHPEQRIVYVSDHRSTGVHFFLSDERGALQEKSRKAVLPPDLIDALPPLRGELSWKEESQDYSWT